MNMLLKILPGTGICNIASSLAGEKHLASAFILLFQQYCLLSGLSGNRSRHKARSPSADYYQDNHLIRKVKIIFYICTFEKASLAQLAEQLIRNEQVVGSSPMRGSNLYDHLYEII